MIIAAIVAAVGVRFAPRSNPTIHVSARSEWDVATKQGKCIVFVDGKWNADMVAFRKPFARFAEWCSVNNRVHAITMTIDPDNMTNDVWKICSEIWNTYQIHSGGLKNYGGAGRVLWLEDGRVADYEWCINLIDTKDIENTEPLKSRTDNTFAKTGGG